MCVRVCVRARARALATLFRMRFGPLLCNGLRAPNWRQNTQKSTSYYHYYYSVLLTVLSRRTGDLNISLLSALLQGLPKENKQK